MSVCEGDTIRFDIQFSAGDKSQLEFFHDGKRVQENDKDGVGISFANDVASLTIQGSAYCTHLIQSAKYKFPGGSCAPINGGRNLEILLRATFLMSLSASLTCRGRGRSRIRAPTSAS